MRGGLLPLGLWLLASALLPACTCKQPGPASEREQPPVVVVDPDEHAAVKATPEQEPNNERGQAQALSAGDWIEARVEASGPDWFRMDITGEALVAKAMVRGVTGLDLHLAAYDATGKRLMQVDNAREGGGEVLVNLSVEPGTYYLRVSEVKGRAGGEARYRIGYQLRGREEGEEVEPNWKAELATPLAVDQEAVGFLGWATDTDWYRVDAAGISASARIRVELDGVDGVRAHLSVRDQAGKLLAERWTAAGGSAVLPNLAPPAPEASHFHVVVRCRKQTNVETRYYLRVMAAVPPGPTEAEPNDLPATANALSPGGATQGLLADRKDRDLYLITAQEPTWVEVTARPPMGVDLELSLLNPAGKAVWTVNAAKLRLPEVMPALAMEPPGALVQVRAVALDQVSGGAPYRISTRLLTRGGFEVEPNGQPALAASAWASHRWPIRGYVHPGDDRDHYRLQAESSRLRLSLAPPPGLTLRAVLTRVDVEGKLAEVQTEPTGGDDQAVMEVDVVEGAEYILVVDDPRAKGDAGQPYVITRENP